MRRARLVFMLSLNLITDKYLITNPANKLIPVDINRDEEGDHVDNEGIERKLGFAAFIKGNV